MSVPRVPLMLVASTVSAAMALPNTRLLKHCEANGKAERTSGIGQPNQWPEPLRMGQLAFLDLPLNREKRLTEGV